eukprot:CAMPEP_0178916086 /NCGR_PEP_ID=MMETSP0786-20121207/12421_1 /TAXON_ID=186022 /ORGANISM="Thalassionema frauenfeldii, Strain CCMP 1798" /LENGTH=597 /DNA_ID=CAMNT_0020589337 /DNA_START=207 /DNA_END=1997 /DNA_ORIENTATION=+
MSLSTRISALTLLLVLLGCSTTSAFQSSPNRRTVEKVTTTSPKTNLQIPTTTSNFPIQQQRQQSSAPLQAKLNGLNGSSSNNNKTTKLQPQVYPQRWVQLSYLSLLALLSDWICFSVAASPSTFETAFPGHSAANLIDIFLFTNVASCFLVTDIVQKVGLQRAIQGAAVVMTLGCWCRSGFGFVHDWGVANALGINDYVTSGLGGSTVPPPTEDGLVSYWLILVGTILVGAAQPFFQCTPPMLSATWFASNERATSTAVALNFNQIGIATAFLVGGGMATSASGLEDYFGLIACLCSLVTVGCLVQFQNLPPSPPSSSEIEKLENGHVEPPFFESVKQFFQTPGFIFPLMAFICSISITNIVGAFIDEVMTRGGITDQFQIDLAGAGFELAILVGGIVIGGYVDKTKEYKKVTLACIAATMALCIPLGLTEHSIGQEPLLLLLALLGLGMAAGPVQPINAELAVDVTYPGDETAVESVQQIGGNLVSALLVPVAEAAAQVDYQIFPKTPELASDIRGDVVLLTVLAGLTLGVFSFFDAPLRRTMADAESEGGGGSNNQDETNANGAAVNGKSHATSNQKKKSLFPSLNKKKELVNRD